METLQEHTEEELSDTPHPAKARGWRRWPPLTMLGAAIGVLVVAALVLSLVAWNSQSGKANRLAQQESLRASAVKAAQTYGVAFGSYDYRNLGGPTASWTVIEDHATAAFRSDYQKTSSQLQPTIVQYKATASATVPLSAASSVSASKASVLLLLKQTITNSTQKSGPQTQQFIVVMDLARQNGQWLIDSVQASA